MSRNGPENRSTDYDYDLFFNQPLIVQASFGLWRHAALSDTNMIKVLC